MEDAHILQVKDLAVSFKETEAVKGISFELLKGKTLGIVGESGSGKSVTALSIMQLISQPGKITAGSIKLKNRDGKVVNLMDLPEKALRKFRGNEVSMIFQEPMTSLNPVYTCGYQVMESLRLHLNLSRREARLRALDLFKKVELPRPDKILKSYPHELSGGQKQRVMIAMAMACNPSVLIADEPTTALDVTVQKSILNLMRQLQEEEGMSVIFITHDLGVIAEIADEVLVVYQGEIVERGNILEVFENPQHPYTQGLLACRPPLDRRLRRLPTIADFVNKNTENGTSEAPPEEIHKPSQILENQTPILTVKRLKTWFPVRGGWPGSQKRFVKAVDDVSFEVYSGETLGLVGESGCGKTTLGRSLLRLIEPSGGEVKFEGTSLIEMGSAEMRGIRKHMQIIFQDPYSSLNPRIPIGKALVEPMIVHKLHQSDKERREVAQDLLLKVGLKAEHINRFPHEFSGGQRQRICIARALAVQPRFIICDESVSALDVSIQAQVLNLLKELQEEFGFTYIFISHDLSVVRFMSDRIMVMKEGKIVEMGNAEAIYSKPKTAYTRQLIEAVPAGSVKNIRERLTQLPS